MADEKNTNQDKSLSAAAGANAGSPQWQPPDVKAQRDGQQADQISGETQQGAHNQEVKNKNPQGTKPDRKQSARKKR